MTTANLVKTSFFQKFRENTWRSVIATSKFLIWTLVMFEQSDNIVMTTFISPHQTCLFIVIWRRKKNDFTKFYEKSRFLILPSWNSLLVVVDEDLATANTVEVEEATGAPHLAVKFRFAPCSSKKWTISMCPWKRNWRFLFSLMKGKLQFDKMIQ